MEMGIPRFHTYQQYNAERVISKMYILFHVALVLIGILVAMMILNLYWGYKNLKKYEWSKEQKLIKVVGVKLKRAILYACLSLILTAIWAFLWVLYGSM